MQMYKNKIIAIEVVEDKAVDSIHKCEKCALNGKCKTTALCLALNTHHQPDTIKPSEVIKSIQVTEAPKPEYLKIKQVGMTLGWMNGTINGIHNTLDYLSDRLSITKDDKDKLAHEIIEYICDSEQKQKK